MRRTRYLVVVVALLVLGHPSVPRAQEETPTCDGESATIVGTAGNDQLTGTSDDDVIVALGGDDDIQTAGGTDRVCGGRGSDVIARTEDLDPEDPDIGRFFGGRGADRAEGGNSPNDQQVFDTLHGGPGNDQVLGHGGNDQVYGSAGSDTLNGGEGYDYVDGGPGNDTCAEGEYNVSCRS